MNHLNGTLTLFTAFAFIGYGLSCVFTQHMVAEFTRYGLSKFRRLTGYLQIMGAAGLIIGIFEPRIGLLAASGLCLQMTLGVVVRIRIRDSWIQASPATSFMFINGYLAYFFANQINQL